ncbi:MAG: LicD Protein, partial [Oscillospiraceae bacterium]|nr:LicD Protein [Oscillospiraceae bacterium]
MENEVLLDAAKKMEVEVLALFDRICKKHNIPYYISYGTLLGAVRHKGFIPWDDDTDVSLLRKDYEKVLKILPEE